MGEFQSPQHSCSGPVFVVGCARSGTSLTCRLLLDHLGVNFGTESQFIVRFHQRLARYGDLARTSNMRTLLRDISRERFFARTRQNFGFVFDVELALYAIRQPDYAGALRAVFEQFAATKGLARWGDKTPEYNRHLETLRELFPDAQFLHVVRDPRAVALSQFNAGFGSKNAYEAAVAWHRDVSDVLRFAAHVPADRYLQFRYEDLIDDPAATLDRIGAFLGIANHQALAAAVREHVRVQVRPVDAHAWRRVLAHDEVACIEAVCGTQLAQFGYDSMKSDAVVPGPLRIARWKLHGLWRRASDPRYWADSLYRLRLRLRDVPFLTRPVVGH